MPKTVTRPCEVLLHTGDAWLDKREAAGYMKISLKSLARLIEIDARTGEKALPTYKVLPGRTVLRRSDIDAYILARRAASQEVVPFAVEVRGGGWV